MEKNIILAGVGGQGILSIAYVIDNAALDAGYQFKQAEVHGMAQRGGAVQSHLRYSDQQIHSDLIAEGRANMVLSVEPLEVMRYWHYLAPDGWVVASVTPYINIPDYPPLETLLEELSTFGNVVLVDSAQLAKAAGNLRAQNMVVVGAAAPFLNFTDDQLLAHVTSLFKAKGERLVEINRRAYAYGRACGLFYRGLVDAGITALAALKLCQRFDPATIDPAHVGSWVDLLGDEAKNLDQLLEGEQPLACDRPALA